MNLQFSSWIDSERIGKIWVGSVRFSRGLNEPRKHPVLISAQLQSARPSLGRHRWVSLEVSCSRANAPASIIEAGNFRATLDESLILQNKSREVEPYLRGRCIYLVGMMGSGKTTVGKIMSEVLNYSFSDSDALVEQEAGGTSVADIFKIHGEVFFRDKETEALQKLSLMHRFVISTGGGAVTRPINWKYMKKGISVWLDVPIEALAKRIAAVGTQSRPLLHHEAGDPYSKAFMSLSVLFEERSEAYANADAKVSLENIAAKLGYGEVSDISPTAIAIEALEQIEGFLKSEEFGF